MVWIPVDKAVLVRKYKKEFSGDANSDLSAVQSSTEPWKREPSQNDAIRDDS